MREIDEYSDFLFYSTHSGNTNITVIIGDETVWTTQQSMSDIFNIHRTVVTKHIQGIFNDKELDEQSNVQKMHIANSDKPVSFYSLDVIIAVGYRANSYEATQFRKWATSILKEYLIKGFALDDDRLKQGKAIFGKDYFEELLERIREIRASERRFYLKITDIYAQCSIDYDADAPITHTFFATVQNKLEFAITHQTAAELIKNRANHKKPFMGLTTWKAGEKGKILKSDVAIAKNYLSKGELKELNAIVTMYLDYAELQATKNKVMKMRDWIEKLDSFLNFNEYDILHNAGKVKAAVAKKFAEKEYGKYRVIQDVEFKSDFENLLAKTFSKKESIKDTDDFNKQLLGLLNTPPPPKKNKK